MRHLLLWLTVLACLAIAGAAQPADSPQPRPYSGLDPASAVPDDGLDRPAVTPALPPPPAGREDAPPPELEPAEGDPAEAAVSEDLLPKPDQPGGAPLHLSDCLDLAFQNHPILRKQIQQVVQAEAQIRVVDASYLPSLYISADKTRQQQQEQFLSQNSVFILQDVTAEVGMNYTIFDAGKRSKQLKAAQATFRSSIRDFQNQWISQTQTITAAYLGVLQAEYQEAIQADNLARTNLNYQVAEAFYQGGLKSMIDVSTARVQQAQAQVAVAQAQNQVKVARITLAQAVGVSESEIRDRVLDAEPILSSTPLPDREAALSYLTEHHPLLASLSEQAASNFANAEVARRANVPVVTANTFYGNSGYSFPTTPVWQVQLQVQFPFFTPNTGPNGDASDAAGHALLAERENQKLILIQQLDTAVANMEGAKKRAAFAVTEVREALFNAEIAYKRYKVGLSDVQELITSLSFVQNSRSDLVSALADLKNAEASYLQALGRIPLPPGLPADTPLMQMQLEEMPSREEALKHALPSPEMPENHPSN